jgi:hypothetical protein
MLQLCPKIGAKSIKIRTQNLALKEKYVADSQEMIIL